LKENEHAVDLGVHVKILLE